MAEAGWYPDPSDGRQVRWFDGDGWTEDTLPMPAHSEPVAAGSAPDSGQESGQDGEPDAALDGELDDDAPPASPPAPPAASDPSTVSAPPGALASDATGERARPSRTTLLVLAVVGVLSLLVVTAGAALMFSGLTGQVSDTTASVSDVSDSAAVTPSEVPEVGSGGGDLQTAEEFYDGLADTVTDETHMLGIADAMRAAVETSGGPSLVPTDGAVTDECSAWSGRTIGMWDGPGVASNEITAVAEAAGQVLTKEGFTLVSWEGDDGKGFWAVWQQRDWMVQMVASGEGTGISVSTTCDAGTPAGTTAG